MLKYSLYNISNFAFKQSVLCKLQFGSVETYFVNLLYIETLMDMKRTFIKILLGYNDNQTDIHQAPDLVDKKGFVGRNKYM